MESFHLFSLGIKSDPLKQVTDHSLRLLDPITEISFDDLAYLTKEDTVSFNQLLPLGLVSQTVTVECLISAAHYMTISHTPSESSLFSTSSSFSVYHDQLQNEDELFEFAKQKLLDSEPELKGGKQCRFSRVPV